MKYIILLLLLGASSALADTEVIVRGKGKTCEQAVENAKIAAVDTAVGLWLSAEQQTDGKQYAERITSYSGGLITKYEVLQNNCTDVTIKAVVVPRTNKMVSNSAYVKQEHLNQLQQQIENDKKRAEIIKQVSDRSKAFAYDISNIELKHVDGETFVVVTGVVHYQEKWLHDYQDLHEQAGGFNLPEFYKPLRVRLTGYNFNKKVFEEKYQYSSYDEFTLYGITRDGWVVINPDATNKIKLTFKVDSGKIMAVDKFEVNLL